MPTFALARARRDPHHAGTMTPTAVKRTRIVATLGPACDDEQTLRGMIRAGLDVVRINFSHQKDAAALAERLARVRAAADAENRPIAILGDLRGPRIRVGEMVGGAVTLVEGATVTLTPESGVVGTAQRFGVTFPALAGDVAPGAALLLDDGNLRLVVLDLPPGGDILCRVERGGVLSSNRGVNLPGRRVSLPSLTPKDLEDVGLAVTHGLDFLALSFVQSAEDVRGLKRELAARGAAGLPVIAKIEKKGGLDDIEAIAAESYGVMVARGDLALEMSLPEVPIAQKRIIAVCRRLVRPVITATQMLESMTTAPKPTRAEATDVANAIFDGTDAVMLSGESAIGKYPVETVATMSAIAARAEAAWLRGELPGPVALPAAHELGATVARAAWEIAADLGARAIVTHTTSGSTTLRVACHRPAMALLALCEREEIRRRLALCWGVESALTDPIQGTTHMVSLAQRFAESRCGARAGESIVVVAGTPYRVSGQTNLIKVATIPEAGTAPAGDED